MNGAVGFDHEFRSFIHRTLAGHGLPSSDGIAMVYRDGVTARFICGRQPGLHHSDLPCARCDYGEGCAEGTKCAVWLRGEDLLAGKAFPLPAMSYPETAVMPAFVLAALGPIGTQPPMQATQHQLQALGDSYTAFLPEWIRLKGAFKRSTTMVAALDALHKLASREAKPDDIACLLGCLLGEYCRVSAWAALIMDKRETPALASSNVGAGPADLASLSAAVQQRLAELNDRERRFFPIPSGSSLWNAVIEFLRPCDVGGEIPGSFVLYGVTVAAASAGEADAFVLLYCLFLAFKQGHDDLGPAGPDADHARMFAHPALTTWIAARRVAEAARRVSEAEQRLTSARQAAKALEGFEDLVGECPAMLDLRLDIKNLAGSDQTVALIGESGTGKEVVARLLHQHSQRSKFEHICQLVAAEMKRGRRPWHLFYPDEESVGPIIQAEYRHVLPGLKVTTTMKNWKPPDEGLLAAVVGAEKEYEFGPNFRHIFRSVLAAIYELWREDPMWNFFEYDSGAADSHNVAAELFGSGPDRYTGVPGNPGRFQVVSHCGGTLFLDNIHNLDAKVQKALLKATEPEQRDRSVVRSGGAVKEGVNVRLIVASTRDLAEMVRDGELSQESKVRIGTAPIRIPPLNERNCDIPLLAKHFARIAGKGLTGDAIEPLLRADWRDSNVRALRAVLRSAANKTAETQHDIPREEVVLSLRRVLTAESTQMVSSPISSARGKTDEKARIKALLEQHEGKIKRVAEELHLTRQQLYRKMDKYEIPKGYGRS